jgi:tripartite-type tricarboxylate transporter receptor subunit TctC
MRHHTRRRLAATFAAATASVVLAGCGGGGGLGGDDDSSGGGGNNASGDEPCAALDGETVTFVVPYNPGGGFDTFARLLEPHLEDQLDGVKVTVENKPGGGGLIGANEVYQSNPDDLTIGLINYPGALFAELTETEGATFDNSKWTVLGRLAALPPLVYTGPDSDITDFDAMINAKEPVVFGIGGVGSDAYYAAVALSEVYGFPTDIVGGYPGSGEADAALLVGEVDASINSGAQALVTIDQSGAQPLVVLSNEPLPEKPDVPVITDFDSDQPEVISALASVYDLERIVVGPPGMDEGTANCLADAIYAAATETSYEDEMEEAGSPAAPLPRDETVELLEQVSGSVDALKDVLQSK